MSFIAGGAYVSFERIRHLHLRHHRDRADVTRFDYKAFLRKRPLLRRLVYSLEWAHLPAVETLMHLQVILRPLLVKVSAAICREQSRCLSCVWRC
jgi:hypothetical protein